MTFEELEKEVKNADSKTDWNKLHAEATALLKELPEEDRRRMIRAGKWSVFERISMHVIYSGLK